MQARLTAKVGPLPVWGWAVVILGAYLLYTRLHRSTATATPVPVTSSSAGSPDSGTQQPSGGGGNAADNLNGDLLAQLLGNQQANQDALLAAVQSLNAEQASGVLGPSVGAVGPTPEVNAPPSAASPNGAAARPSPYVQTDTGSFVFTPVTLGSNPAAALAGAEVATPFHKVGVDGTVASAVRNSPTVIVDPSGHVVNAKGARVGGRTAE